MFTQPLSKERAAKYAKAKKALAVKPRRRKQPSTVQAEKIAAQKWVLAVFENAIDGLSTLVTFQQHGESFYCSVEASGRSHRALGSTSGKCEGTYVWDILAQIQKSRHLACHDSGHPITKVEGTTNDFRNTIWKFSLRGSIHTKEEKQKMKQIIMP